MRYVPLGPREEAWGLSLDLREEDCELILGAVRGERKD